MNRPQRPNETFGVTVSANETAYVAGRALALTVRGPSAFCGFLVVSEDADGNRVGSFAPSAEAAVREGCAGEPNATATHTAQFDNQTSLLLFWTASATVNYGPVTFRLVVLSGRRGAAASQLIYWPAPITVPSAQGPKPTAAPMPVDTTCATPPPPLVGCPEAQAGIVPWSVWRANATADDWQNVTVPAGSIVLLDVTPPKINQLDVRGQLVVTPAAAARVALRARFIYVHACAHLWVGSRDCPVLGAVDIELHGDPAPKVNPAGFGTKVLAGLPGSQIDIHGRPTSFAWTQLGAHAVKGSRRIELAETPRGWGRNDEIVIASTQFIAGNDVSRIGRTERRTVVDVVNRTVTWNGAALLTTHYGAVYRPAGAPDEHAIDMRAEVALLTRNVKIHGDVSGRSYDAGWGGHVMVLGAAELRIQDAELFDMGQAGELARYPIHFHVTRNNSKSYVVRNSIHDTFQRCVTVHGTNQLLVQGNAAYNSRGHCYFIEDADEVDNVFDRNLGIDPQPHTLLRSDATPAVFWITHPGNHFYRNRAAGGAFGFWYAMPQHPTGLATNADTEHLHWPIHAPLGDFVDNAAHGQRAGLFVDRGLAPDGSTPLPASSYEPLNLDVAAGEVARLKMLGKPIYPQLLGERLVASFVNFTAYKQADFGVWTRGAGALVHNARIADCLVGASMPQGAQIMQESVFIGETDNDPDEPPNNDWRDLPIVGYRSYDTGFADLVVKSTFYDFRDKTQGFPLSSPLNRVGVRQSGAVSGQTGPNTLPPFNLLLANRLVRVDNPVFYYRYDVNGSGATVDLRDFDPATKGVVHYDVDGSLTGVCGAAVVGSSALLRHSSASCVERAPWHAFVCDAGARAAYQYLEFDATADAWNDANGVSPTLVEDALLYIYRLGAEPANMTQRPLVSGEYACPTAQEPNRICTSVRAVWNTNVLSGFEYAISLLNLATPKRFRVGATFTSVAEWTRVHVAAPVAPLGVYNADGKPLPSAAAAANLSASAPWFWDAAAQRLSLHLQVGRGIFESVDAVGNTYAVEVWNVDLRVDLRSCTGANEALDALRAPTLCRTPTAPALAASAPLGGLAPAPGPSRCGWTSQYTQVTPSGAALPLFVHDASSVFTLVTDGGVTGVSVATNAGVVPGTNAIAVDWALPGIDIGNGQIQAVIFRAPTAVNRAAYTHVQFRIRAATSQGRRIKLLLATTRSLDFDATVGNIVHVVASANGGDSFIDEDGWSLYTVPFATLDATSNFTAQVILFGAEQRAVMFYVDEVRFIVGTSSQQNVTGWPLSVPVKAVLPANYALTLPLLPATTTAATTPATTSTPTATSTSAANATSAVSGTTSAVVPSDCRFSIVQQCKSLCGAHRVAACRCESDGSPAIECSDGSRPTSTGATPAPTTTVVGATVAPCRDTVTDACVDLCGEDFVVSCRCTSEAPDIKCAAGNAPTTTAAAGTTSLVVSEATAPRPSVLLRLLALAAALVVVTQW